MTKTVHGKPARAGDKITVAGHAVGVPARWARSSRWWAKAATSASECAGKDGHESIFFPGDDALIERPAHGGRARLRSGHSLRPHSGRRCLSSRTTFAKRLSVGSFSSR
jgi:hypothetical protein